MANTATNQEREMRVAVERVVGFAQEFGEAHLNLACHAAFPLSLTPDLLYQIWANFVPEAPWTAIARVLLSRLCKEVGSEMYEMDNAVRNLLLRSLKEQFGQERFDSLGEFLLEYVSQRLTDDDPDTQDLQQAQKWTALAYTKPEQAARELARTLSDKVQQEDTGEVLRLSSLVETLSEPLVEAGFEPLLVYGQGMKSYACGNLEESKVKFSSLSIDRTKIYVAGIRLIIPNKILENKLPSNIDIGLSLLGHARAGKTAYLMSLYDFNNSQESEVLINAEYNKNTFNFNQDIHDFIQTGQFPPATLSLDEILLRDLHLKITFKKQTNWFSNKSHVEIDLSIKEYSAEFYNNLCVQKLSSQATTAIQDIVLSDGIMFFIDPLSTREHIKYIQSFEMLFSEFINTRKTTDFLRIALIFTKCDQGEIFPFRFEPQEIAKIYFPNVYRMLKNLEKQNSIRVEYFCTSVVGTIGKKDPRPNKAYKIDNDKNKEVIVVKYPKLWKPFGLISPIYWLYTGKRYKDMSV